MSSHTLPVGILNDESLTISLKWGEPLITNSTESLIKACSYDLRVGTVFNNGKILRWKSSEEQVVIQPGGIISLFTHEEVQLPNDIMATAFPMNYWSSQGLLVLNPGHVDPGFHGPLSVRLINIRSTPKNINLGDAIFTVIFEKLPKGALKPYQSNKLRDLRERDHNSLDLEQNPRGLGQLILRGENPPFQSEKEIRQIISEFWVTRLIFVFTAVAAVAGVIAVIQGFRDKPEPSKTAGASTAAIGIANPVSNAVKP
jgi:deoxycytidine triphosphate deaminase